VKAKFSTICSREKLAEIRSFLHTVLAGLEIAQGIKDEIILAVDEACANAIIHGNQCDATRPLQLEVNLNEDKLSVEIFDVGDSHFNAEAWRDKDINEIIRNKQKGGLGLKLMYSIMDEVRYHRTGDRHVCTMEKRLQ